MGTDTWGQVFADVFSESAIPMFLTLVLFIAAKRAERVKQLENERRRARLEARALRRANRG